MANKILLSNRNDVGDYYEQSDSENEYTEHEKKLLQKVRKGKQRNEDPQEILAFDQNDDDSDGGLYGNFPISYINKITSFYTLRLRFRG